MEIEFKGKRVYRFDEAAAETQNSSVYRAKDLSLERFVGLKVVRPPENFSGKMSEWAAAVRREVTAMVAIDELSARVPYIIDSFFEDDTFYISMQWIEGKDLNEKMDAAPATFIGWMIDLCDILSIMERRKRYHRDIKPANIRIDQNGNLYLIDFNISISRPVIGIGTSGYAAPEMTRHVDAEYSRSDMFSIGVILYRYFTGEMPQEGVHYAKEQSRRRRPLFGADKGWTLFRSPKEIKPDITDSINDIIVKCMKYHPQDRYENFLKLKAALVKAAEGVKNGRRT